MPVRVANISYFAFDHITAGAWHTCALLDYGAVYCWGDNEWGQLGRDSSVVQTSAPVHNNLHQAVNVTSGPSAWHTCVTVQLPQASVPFSNAPPRTVGDTFNIPHPIATQVLEYNAGSNAIVPVAPGELVQVASSALHTVALKEDGTVWSWGIAGGYDSSHAVPVTWITNAVQVAAGDYYSRALMTNGEAYCWGYGAVYCWGKNTSMQRGDTNTTSVTLPSAATNTNLGPLNAAAAVDVVAGRAHTCVKLPGQTPPACWSDNTYGQLGDGTQNGPRAAPQFALVNT